ncbi:MAG TPA: hypothetical protein VK427_12645 [Kofleriaceae bacterium]|nr:hypothetical protein [Kofleriaceae bacterium]
MDVFLLRALAPMAAISVLVGMLLVAAPLALYVIARWRAHRDAAWDPHLGLKFALHYFAFSAYQLLLAGIALLIYMLISPNTADKGSDGYRAAIALIMPAAVVLAAHVSLLKRTNDTSMPGVRRLFWGYNMLLSGIVAFSALVLGFQVMFAKGPSGGLGHFAGAVVVVYGIAWALLGLKLAQLVLGGPSGGAPDEYVPPPGVAVPPVQPQPGLPALGGGAFPPIDPA